MESGKNPTTTVPVYAMGKCHKEDVTGRTYNKYLPSMYLLTIHQTSSQLLVTHRIKCLPILKQAILAHTLSHA